MFGLDQWVVHFSDGTTLLIVLVVAVLLGLRHASDPDHLTAVTTLVTNGRGGATRLGLTWGLGHASSLLALGVPIVLWKAYLPARRRGERRGDDRPRDHGARALAAPALAPRCVRARARAPEGAAARARRCRRTGSGWCTGSAAAAASACCCSLRSTAGRSR